VFFEK